MKLILTQEVSGLGAPGEIVEVKDGYARNFLVPQGLGSRWTKGGEKQIATIRRAREVRAIQDLGEARDVASALGSLSVTLTARAGQGGRLFGSVTVVDVVDAVLAAGGPKLDRRRVEIAAPIKTVGSHQVSVRLHDDVAASIDVEVVAES
jgi:large subunit ribosomal protein L9